jgi:hypothetical protein
MGYTGRQMAELHPEELSSANSYLSLEEDLDLQGRMQTTPDPQ